MTVGTDHYVSGYSGPRQVKILGIALYLRDKKESSISFYTNARFEQIQHIPTS